MVSTATSPEDGVIVVSRVRRPSKREQREWASARGSVEKRVEVCIPALERDSSMGTAFGVGGMGGNCGERGWARAVVKS
jgi:hypothetical protein